MQLQRGAVPACLGGHPHSIVLPIACACERSVMPETFELALLVIKIYGDML
jgi:hypothetical protein